MPLHLRARDAGLGKHAADGGRSGGPPVLGALLGPQGALHADIFVGSGGAGTDNAALVHQ